MDSHTARTLQHRPPLPCHGTAPTDQGSALLLFRCFYPAGSLCVLREAYFFQGSPFEIYSHGGPGGERAPFDAVRSVRKDSKHGLSCRAAHKQFKDILCFPPCVRFKNGRAWRVAFELQNSAIQPLS